MIFLWKLEMAWGTLTIKDFVRNVEAKIMSEDQFKQVTGKDYQEVVNPPAQPTDTTQPAADVTQTPTDNQKPTESK